VSWFTRKSRDNRLLTASNQKDTWLIAKDDPSLAKARWPDVSGVFCGTVSLAYLVVRFSFYWFAACCGISHPCQKNRAF